jgi:hypothetical protein
LLLLWEAFDMLFAAPLFPSHNRNGKNGNGDIVTSGWNDRYHARRRRRCARSLAWRD